MPSKKSAKKEVSPKPKSGKKKDSGVVFDTTEKKFDEEELRKKFENLSFDPFDLTNKIIEFGKALTGIPLYEYQEKFAFRIIFSVITFEGESLTALWSRQAGKSEDMAFVIDTLCVILPELGKMYTELQMFKNGFKVGLYAPQQLQVNTTYDRAMERISSENAEMILDDPEIQIGLTSAKYLQLTNGSSLTGQVASKTSKIESKTYHLVIVEESQETDDFIVQKSIEPMVSATGGTILKIGTTGTQKNNFYFEIQNNRKRQKGIKDDRLLLHYEFDYKQVIEYKRKQYEVDGNNFHLMYERDVLKKRAKWGEDSEAFKLGYGLKWPLDSGMFITDTDFEKICNKRLGFPRPDRDITDDWTICAGIDFGKDVDSTVVTVARVFYPDEEYTTEPPKKQLIHWMELKGVDYESQHYLILNLLIDWNVQVAYVDYTGVGKPATDRLMAACGDNVSIVPYTFSRPSKSDMWMAFDADVKAGRWIIPCNKSVKSTPEFQHFEEQMKGLYKWYEQGYMVCQHGDGAGEHDDYPDSMGLCTLACNHELPQEAEEEDNVFFQRENNYIPSHRNAHW